MAIRVDVETAHPGYGLDRIVVTVDVTPGRPGSFDPWDGGSPPEGPEVEVVSARALDGSPVALADQDVDALLDDPAFVLAADERAADARGDEMPDAPEGE